RRSGRSYTGLCPFHSERTPSFHVTPEKGLYYCFGCGAGGTVINFVMAIEEIGFHDAVRRLAARTGMALPTIVDDATDDREHQHRAELLACVELAAKFYNHILMNHEAGAQGLAYILGRGIAKKTIATFNLGFSPVGGSAFVAFATKRGLRQQALLEAGLAQVTAGGEVVDRFRGRLMFPICDSQGRPIAFGARSLGQAQPKYVNSSESALFKKGRILYGFDKARQAIRQSGRAVLVEGYMDVISLHQAGVRTAVAALGTALTAEQAGFLRRVAQEVVVLYDGDQAGQAAALKNVALLCGEGLAGVRVAALPDGADPDEWVRAHGAEAFVQEVLERAVGATEYRVRALTADHPHHLGSGRAAYLRDAIKVIAHEPSPIERESVMSRLATVYGMPIESLRDDLRLQLQLRDRQETAQERRGGQRSALPVPPDPLQPAEYAAERRLIMYMLQDAQWAKRVRDTYYGEFVHPIHAALQAYLYAFYEEREVADPALFMLTVDDAEVVQYAASLLHQDMQDKELAVASQDLDDCVRCLQRRDLRAEHERVTEEMTLQLASGDTAAFARSGELLKDIQARLLQV
ncbi:MAG: DNA primase, partial [Firmicutes bacterium]|nr:DNA primase [Bacillota bacterium]